MARGVNKVILIGNLGADPETRYTSDGYAITSIRLATSESWRDKQSGGTQERTEWHRVKFFGKLAEIAGEYLKKGRQVYVEGSLRTEKYAGKDGQEKFSTEIVANEMRLLGSDDSSRQRADGAHPPTQQHGTRSGNAPRQARSPEPAIPAGSGGGDWQEDDIPFSPMRRRAYW